MKTIFKISAVTMSLGVVSCFTSLKVTAHGYMDSPKARQAICQAQGGYWWPKDGTNIPNLACRAAFLESGHVQFIQEHEFAVNTPDYFNQAAVEANVPNGTLCAGGDNQKRGMDIPSADWQKTVVTPNNNGEIKIRYRATTPHNPSFWRFYLTNEGFNTATDTLTWQDLTLVQSHENIDFVKDTEGKRYYEMQVSIPTNRSGDAILYSRWQRNDVVGEGFYNCSDITITRDAITPNTWHDIGYFIRQGQQAKAGDTVQVRLFDETGNELVNQLFQVTTQNQENWQAELAQSLNLDYASSLRIGVKLASGEVLFDEANPLSNQVFATHKDHSYALSIQAPTPNTAPVVMDVDAQMLDENSTLLVHVHAFDDENDPLTYQFSASAPLTLTQDGANVTLNASSVEQDTTVDVSVVVSDGQLSTTKTFPVTIKNVPIVDPTDPLWDASKAYKAGDIVSYNSHRYQAKWWVKGEKPDTSAVWHKLSAAGDNTWQASIAYQAGDIVSHQGMTYQARWWTQGEEPGSTNVWQKQQ